MDVVLECLNCVDAVPGHVGCLGITCQHIKSPFVSLHLYWVPYFLSSHWSMLVGQLKGDRLMLAWALSEYRFVFLLDRGLVEAFVPVYRVLLGACVWAMICLNVNCFVHFLFCLLELFNEFFNW